MRIFKFLLLGAAILGVTSCYKDLGNYDYTKINELGISLDPSYTAYYGSNFRIEPVVEATIAAPEELRDTTKYSYEWSAVNPGALYHEQRKVISTKPVLDVTVDILPASYTLYLRITDRTTGVMWERSARLAVVTQIYEGWLLLNEVGGKSRLDMLSKNDTGFAFLPSVLDSVSSGLDMSGKPVSVHFSPNAGVLISAVTKGIYISTSKGTNRIDEESFKWNPQMNIRYQFYANIPDTFVADNIFGRSYEEFIHSATDNNIYYYYRVMNIKYGVPLNIIADESPKPFKTSKYFAKGGNSQAGIVFYDTDNKRFVRAASAQTGAAKMPDDHSYFDYNTGMDLKYMQYTPYGNGEVFAILHDANTNKNYLARFTLSSSINQTYYAEITGEDFEKAENYAVDPVFGYLFYSVGGKVYEYDMGSRQSFLMLDKGSDKISVLKFHRFTGGGYSSGEDALANKLIVASYNPGGEEGKNGTMELFNVPQVNGQISLDQSYKGLGKIVSLTYRER